MHIPRFAEALERGKKDRETLELAVDLARRMFSILPVADIQLANSLRLLARQLCEEGEHEQASALIDEAVRICRNPDVVRKISHEVQLAWTLGGQADILTATDRGQAAVAVAQEAVTLCRARLFRHPHRFGPALVWNLISLSLALEAVGRSEEALTVGTELVAILRRLAPRRPRYEPALARATHNLGVNYASVGRLSEALRANSEAMDLLMPLLRRQPDNKVLTADWELSSRNHDVYLDLLEQEGKVILGAFPLCAQCEQTNGGLIAVRHRQRHIRVGDRESCVDDRLSEIVTTLWEHGCDTRTSCQEYDPRAVVTVGPGQAALGVRILATLGIDAETVQDTLYFTLPTD